MIMLLRFEGHFMEDIAAAVDKDYNHPCCHHVFSVMKLRSQWKKKGLQTGRSLSRHFTEKDPTRPVTAGINLTLLYMASPGLI